MNKNRFYGLLSVVGILLSQQSHAEEKVSLPSSRPFDLKQVNAEKDHFLHEGFINTDQTQVFRISGQITAARSASLPFVVAGIIKSIYAKPGIVVKKGQTIAELDNRDYLWQLESAKAQKKLADIKLLMLKKELAREKQLKKNQATTTSQLEKVELEYNQAQIALELATIGEKSAEKNLASTKLVAPYDCIIAKQHKDESEYVNVGTLAVDIHEINQNQLDLDVPEPLVGKLKIGSKLLVTIPSVAYLGQAVVQRIVPVISKEKRSFQVVANFEGNDDKIMPGLFAEAQIQVGG